METLPPLRHMNMPHQTLRSQFIIGNDTVVEYSVICSPKQNQYTCSFFSSSTPVATTSSHCCSFSNLGGHQLYFIHDNIIFCNKYLLWSYLVVELICCNIFAISFLCDMSAFGHSVLLTGFFGCPQPVFLFTFQMFSVLLWFFFWKDK
jgi:hypothetical protein